MPETRSETDSFGPIDVPSDKYWGAQTQRSIKNFPIGWEKQPIAIVRSLGIIKKACAQANIEMGIFELRSDNLYLIAHNFRARHAKIIFFPYFDVRKS